MNNNETGVIVVGGGIMGICCAYFLAMKGKKVTLLDQYDVPNIWSASGDHLRVFRLTYGKDAFYTDMAARAMPLWLDFNEQSGDRLLYQNGVLEFATQMHGYEEQSYNVLKEMKLQVAKIDKNELKRRYPMLNTRAIKYGVFHKDGGMIWAQKSVAAIAALAQRKGAQIRPQTKVAQIILDKKTGIKGLKDANGKTWTAESYVFCPGVWGPELKTFKLPVKVTKQFQMYLRPPSNRGRYRPEHFPVFASLSTGFYGFPLHIHGFLKIADHKKGPGAKPVGPGSKEEITPAFEKKCRKFLGRFIPELAHFTESEGQVCYYDNTKDGDFILDRLPQAANGYVAAGFSGHGFKFAPLIGKTMAELVVSGKSELNLHRFRISRFKGR
jgi:N-methyl-L-tryptophan oxidase